MSQHQTRFIRPIFYFFPTTARDVDGSFTSMLSPWSMLPRATRRLNLWLPRKREKSLERWSASTSEALSTWPKLLQVDPGKEFMGAVLPLLARHNTEVRRGRVDIHRDQAIVERFNRTLAERLFGYQYAQEMLLPEGERSVDSGWLGCLRLSRL